MAPIPLLLIVSAPSGAGKTTLCDRLLRVNPGMVYSVSCTTRPPREGECDGVDYTFLSDDEFQRRIRKEAFLEHARVHGYEYGTLRDPVLASLKAGFDVVMDIDVQGAAQIRESLGRLPDGDPMRIAYVDLFISPPSLEELKRRLISRGKDTSEVVERRLRQAREEMARCGEYQYGLVNEDLEEAAKVLEAIVIAERHRISRFKRRTA